MQAHTYSCHPRPLLPHFRVTDAHQFNENAQLAEEAAADALDGLTRIMIVPNQVRGIDYNATPARELATVPDQPLCGPAFVGGVYNHCQDNAMRWTRANSTNIRGFSATAWFTGKYVREKLGEEFGGVPIGLVRSSWGGTQLSPPLLTPPAPGIPHLKLSPLLAAPVTRATGLSRSCLRSNLLFCFFAEPRPRQQALRFKSGHPKRLWRRVQTTARGRRLLCTIG